MMNQNNRGFTLTELSIAVLIISFLAGGVLLGRQIIRSASNQGMITDLERYESAYKTFRLKYKRSPGDMPNAFEYFANTIGCTDLDVNTDNNGCNGDGNGRIGNQSILNVENLRAHQHLSAASILSTVDITTGVDVTSAVIGQNSPPSLYRNEATYFFSSDNLNNNYKNINSISISAAQNDGWDAPVVEVLDALSVDTKIDDANPYTGKVIAYNENDSECVATSLLSSVIANKKDAVYLSAGDSLCVLRLGLSDSFR